MEELKIIFASNLIRKRTENGWTQAELAEKINYSDKSVSKWERAESLPDVSVLKQISDLFGVTVDYMISAHDDWEKPERINKFSTKTLTLVVMTGIWTLALLVFILFWIFGKTIWLVFPITLPISIITFLVFNCIWHERKNNLLVVELLVLSIFLLLYLVFYKYNLWQIFILLIPSMLIVYFSFHIKNGLKRQ